MYTQRPSQYYSQSYSNLTAISSIYDTLSNLFLGLVLSKQRTVSSMGHQFLRVQCRRRMRARQMEGLRGRRHALRQAAWTFRIRGGSLGPGCSGGLRSRCSGRSLFNRRLVCSSLADTTIAVQLLPGCPHCTDLTEVPLPTLRCHNSSYRYASLLATRSGDCEERRLFLVRHNNYR